jgi:hypothetical protein
MTLYIDGAIMMQFCVAGLFFLRFWRDTRDRLFLMFAVSFLIMAVNRFFIAWFAHGSIPNEHAALFYAIRLVAFVIILVAIVDKNRHAQPAASHGP